MQPGSTPCTQGGLPEFVGKIKVDSGQKNQTVGDFFLVNSSLLCNLPIY